MSDQETNRTRFEQQLDDLSLDRKKAEKRAEKMKEQAGEPIAKKEADRDLIDKLAKKNAE